MAPAPDEGVEGVDAQTQQLPDQAAQELIVVGYVKAWSSAGGSASTFVGEEIIERQSTHPNELFNRVAGVWVSRGSGQEHLTAIRSPVLTGAGACGAFLVTVNSVPIRPSGFCNVNELLEVQLGSAAAVSVVKGPASAVIGGNALHGAIDVTPAMVGDAQFVEVVLAPQGYKRALLGASGTLWRADAALTHDEGWRDDSRYAHQQITLSRSSAQGQRQNLLLVQFSDLNQETAGYISGLDAYKSSSASRGNSNPEAFRNASALRISHNTQQPLSKGGRLSITAYARHTDMTFIQHFLPGKPLEDNGHKSLGFTLDIDAQNGHEFGGTFETAQVFLRELQIQPRRFSRPQGLHYNYQVDSLAAGFYYRLRKTLNQWVDLGVDLRAEHLAYDYDNKMLAGNTDEAGRKCGTSDCYYSRPEDRKDSFTNLGYRVAISGRVSQAQHRWHVALASAFRPPQMTELYRLRGAQKTSSVDSESLRGLDASIAGVYKNMDWSLAAFVQAKYDAIYRSSDNEYLGSGRTSHRGVEWSLQWRVGEWQKFIWQGLWSRHNYGFNAAVEARETIKSGNEVDTAPRWISGGVWRLERSERFTFELEGEYMGRYYIDAANTHDYLGHTLWHARLFFRSGPKTTLGIKVRNLADSPYADRADFSGFSGHRYFPGRGRTWYVSLRRAVGDNSSL